MKFAAVLYSVIFASLMLFEVASGSNLPRLKDEHGKRKSKRSALNLMTYNCFIHERDAATINLWSRTKQFKITAYFEEKEIRKLFEMYTLHWSLINKDTNKNVSTDPPYDRNLTFVIEPYSLPSGNYKVVVKAIFYKDGVASHSRFSRACYLVIKEEKPVAVISGGFYQVVPGWRPVEIDGSASIDMSVDQNTPSTLSYQWTCQQTRTTRPFCTGVVGQQPTLSVEAKYMEPDQKITFTLKVTSYDGAWSSLDQTLEIVASAALININCEKNCPPTSAVTVPTISTVLYAGCEDMCTGIQDEDYEWKFFINKKPPEEIPKLAKTGPKYTIAANKLMPNEYLARVNLKGPRRGEASLLLKFIAPPSGIKCTVKPRSGQAMITIFQLNCKFRRPDTYFFEIYEAVRGKFPGELYAGGQGTVSA